MINVLGVFISLWKYVTKHVSSTVPIVLVVVLAGLIWCYVAINSISPPSRIDITIKHTNSELRKLDIRMDLNTFKWKKQTDKITIRSITKQHIEDSLFANHGKDNYSYRDSLEQIEAIIYDLKGLRKWDSNEGYTQFQNALSVNVRTREKVTLDIRVPEYTELKVDSMNGLETIEIDRRDMSYRREHSHRNTNETSGYSITYGHFFAIDGKDLYRNFQRRDSFPNLTKARPYRDSLTFPTGNRLYMENSRDERKWQSAEIDYYIKYNKDASKYSGQDIVIEGDIVEPDRHGEVVYVVSFNIRSDAKVDMPPSNGSQIVIRFGNTAITNFFDIQPTPDKITATSFVYDSPVKIENIISEGLILNGQFPSKQRISENINFWITLGIGAIFTFLMTMLIDRWNTWERKIRRKRKNS